MTWPMANWRHARCNWTCFFCFPFPLHRWRCCSSDLATHIAITIGFILQKSGQKLVPKSQQMKKNYRRHQRNVQNTRLLPLKWVLFWPSLWHAGIHGRWAPHRLGLRGGVRRPSSRHGFGYTPVLGPARGAPTQCAPY